MAQCAFRLLSLNSCSMLGQQRLRPPRPIRTVHEHLLCARQVLPHELLLLAGPKLNDCVSYLAHLSKTTGTGVCGLGDSPIIVTRLSPRSVNTGAAPSTRSYIRTVGMRYCRNRILNDTVDLRILTAPCVGQVTTIEGPTLRIDEAAA